MTDFIGQFKEDQEKKIFVKPTSHSDEWGFEPDIKHIEPVEKPAVEEPPDDTINKHDLNEIVTEAVLNFMNGPDAEPTELLEEQKMEVEKKIKDYCNHLGMMSIYFGEEPQLNEAWVGAIIDPTNKKSWIHLKQEKICTVPYAYRKPLLEYAKKVWNENKKVV